MATDFLRLSKEAFDASTSYIDSNLRGDWEYSLRAFRNEHAAGSKYLSEEFKARSHLYRPKTRTIIRKNEAAAAVALFSNMEVVDLQPGDPDNPQSLAARDAMKALLEYRLTRTIPAFPICMGGLQDAQTQGAVISYQYWEYQVKNGRKVKDKPCIELRPIENIRFDSGASWIDPVESSPYWCDIIPMYVCDVRAMMNNKDDKTGAPKWKKHDDSVIMRAKPSMVDTTSKARMGRQQTPEEKAESIKDFDLVWVMRWFMRDGLGDDYTYYTLGTEELLSEPEPLEKVYFHGIRPYAMGYAILETHKALKTSMPILIKPLQQETNDIANQRIDNVKLVLNKRYYVARGRQVDVQSLVRNVPGGVTLLTDPKTDVVEANWNDVTSSSYVEQDRINSDMDDVAGNFSPSTKVANNAINDTLGGSRMAAQGAGLMTDYLLRTVIETWWEPVLRQLIKLEAAYETDENILALAAKKARLFPKYGLSRITDDLLLNDVMLSVNVGMGSSNPQQRMQNFMMATQAAIVIVTNAPPGFNVPEAIKEIYSNAGYRDGARFFSEQQDPRLMKAMQMIQQLKQVVQGKQMELQATGQIEMAKIASTERIKGAEVRVNAGRIQGDLGVQRAQLALDAQRLELEKVQFQIEAGAARNEAAMKLQEFNTREREAAIKLQIEYKKLEGQALKIRAEIEKAANELETVKGENANQKAAGETMKRVGEMMSSVSAEMAAMHEKMAAAHGGVGDVKGQVAELNKGLGALAGFVLQKKRKPVKLTLKKKDGKSTNSVQFHFDDGTMEDMAVDRN